MSNVKASDVRGLIQLTLRTASMVTDVVEHMHQTIAEPFDVLGHSNSGRTGGITGLVYRSIQKGYDLVGAGVNAAGSVVEMAMGERESTAKREAMVAGLNGVFGDHLAERANPLAVEMALRQGGRPLVLEREALRAALPDASPKVLVLVHGLCMNDLLWARGGHDHGAALAEELGYTPIYLNYNSGAHISTNGRAFAEMLERTIEEWPVQVEELVIIGHSMGGLVARSACVYGERKAHVWRRHLRKLIFLGTPHHGSPWERIGAWTSGLATTMRYTAPFYRFTRTRSVGITDLRYGYLVEEEWMGQDQHAHGPDDRHSVPLPARVDCYAIAATLGTRLGDKKDVLLGDGLVPVSSALGMHAEVERRLVFEPERQWIGYGMGHLDLLSRPEVYEKIEAWCR